MCSQRVRTVIGWLSVGFFACDSAPESESSVGVLRSSLGADVAHDSRTRHRQRVCRNHRQTRIGDVEVRSRADMRALWGVKCITGSLTVTNTSLTTLAGLRSLEFIGESLFIRENHSLLNLGGLESLRAVDSVEVFYNLVLTDLFTPRSDMSLQSYWISGNYQLPACKVWELESLLGKACGTPEVGPCDANTGKGSCGVLPPDFECMPGARGPGVYDGSVIIYRGSLFPTFGDLGGVTCITGDAYLGLEQFTDLNELANLQKVGGQLTLANTQDVVDLSGLENLTSVGSLRISNNLALRSLSGLSRLTELRTAPPDVPILYIANNPNLSACTLVALEEQVAQSCGTPGTWYECSGNAGTEPCGRCAIDNGGCDLLTSCRDERGVLSCGDCPDGFSGSGMDGCTDIDECALNQADCDVLASCSNQVGGYACTCPVGAQELLGHGTQCVTTAQLAGGTFHTCGITRTGALYCWGSNGWGQLGDETTMDRSTPVRVGLSNDWQAIAAGGNHSCGIRSGQLYCWGSASARQLGNPNIPGGDSRVPVQVGTDADWQAVSAAYEHTCGIRAGELYCWGNNRYNQLDDTTLNDVFEPKRIGTLPDWSRISAASYRTCGIRHGLMSCLGSNSKWMFDDDPSGDDGATTQMGTDSDWTHVTSGISHNCGIRDGSVYCWGENATGELGVESMLSSLGPARVGGPGGWTAISVGERHSCGIRAGQLYCWGSNDFGQLGDGTMTTRWLPTPVGEETDWLSVQLGAVHSCGVRAGQVFCWGLNRNGQLGDGTTVAQLVPTAIGDGIEW